MNLQQIKTWATNHKTPLLAGGAAVAAGAALYARSHASGTSAAPTDNGLALSTVSGGSDTNAATGAQYSSDYLDAINNVADSLGQQISGLSSTVSSEATTIAGLQKTTSTQASTITSLKNTITGLTNKVNSAPKPTAAKPAPGKTVTTPKPSPKPKPTAKTYTVKAGDTLSAIAKKLHVPLATLEKTNAAAIKKQGNNNLIHPGLKLKY